MPFTNFPSGVTSFGIPLFGGARFSNPWSTHYFVDGDDGSDGHNGKTPDRAFKTIQKAVTASIGGDVIYIKPKAYIAETGFGRYSEDVVIPPGGTAGGSEIVPNANISIIGVTPRPVPTDFLGARWTFATNTPLNVEAPGAHVENIGFYTEGATHGVYFEGEGATWGKIGHTGSSMYNCAIKGEGGVFANGSDELQFVNCRFQAKYDGTTSGIIITLDGTNVCRRPIVRGCTFIGGNGTAMASAPIIWTGKVEDGFIADNFFHTGTSVIINIVTGGSSGLITRNSFAEANLSTTFIVQNGMVAVENYDLTGLAAGV